MPITVKTTKPIPPSKANTFSAHFRTSPRLAARFMYDSNHPATRIKGMYMIKVPQLLSMSIIQLGTEAAKQSKRISDRKHHEIKKPKTSKIKYKTYALR